MWRACLLRRLQGDNGDWGGGWLLECSMGELTLVWMYPHVARNFFLRGLWKRLDVLFLGLFLLRLRVWESGLEHSRRADEAVT